MIAKRLLALVVAVALVVGAVVVRDRMFGADDVSDDVASPTADEATGGEVPDLIRVTCAEELETACEALAGQEGEPAVDVRIEPVEDTLTALTEADPAVDVWLTLEPWPAMAAQRREVGGLRPVLSDAVPLAASEMTLVARDDRIGVLTTACDGTLNWRCIGEAAGDPWTEHGGESGWGTVRIGFGDPTTSAAGLLALAHATSGYFDGATFNSQDLRDTGFFAWLDDLASSMRPAGPGGPLRQLITQRATLDMVDVLGVDAQRGLEADQAVGLTATEVAPPLPARVVAVGVGDAGPDSAAAVAERVMPLLVEAGWTEAPAGAAEPGDTGTTEPDGLPSAGALEALRREWLGVS